MPSVRFQLHVPSDDPSRITGSAAVVSSQWSPLPRTIDCISDFGMQMSRSSFAPLTCCEPPPGLVGPQFLDETQRQRIPVGDDAEACHARSPSEKYECSPSCSTSGTSSRRQAPVKSECLPKIHDLVPNAEDGVTASRNLGQLARVIVRAQGQPAGKEEGSESSDESGSLPEPKSARVVPGRRQHRLRIPTYHMMCRDGTLEKLLLEQ